MCLLLRLDLTFFSTISYRNSQLMFFSLGDYLTHNSYRMENVDWIWIKQNRTKQENGEMIWYERQKRQNCAYRWWGLCQTFWLMNTQTSALTLLNLIHVQLPPKKGGFLDTHLATWSIKEFFFFFLLLLPLFLRYTDEPKIP